MIILTKLQKTMSKISTNPLIQSNSLVKKNSKHPYMHKKNSLDYIYVMKGSIVLILDEDQVQLNQGDTIVNLGGNHAWSNRTDSICELFISSHSSD